MEPTHEFVDELFWERVERARNQSLGQKLLDGFELFEQSCHLARMGIRYEHPDADAARVEQLLREQLERLRELDEYGLYHPVLESVES